MSVADTPTIAPPPPERASTPDLAGAGVHGRSLGHLCPSTTIRRRYWAHSPHCRNQPPGGATHAGNSVPLPSAIAAAGVPSMPSPKGRKRDSGSRGRGNVRVGRPFASAPAKTAQNGLSKEGRDRRIHSPGSPEGSVRCGHSGRGGICSRKGSVLPSAVFQDFSLTARPIRIWRFSPNPRSARTSPRHLSPPAF